MSWLPCRELGVDVRTRSVSDVSRAVHCTHPVPLHAHTHFLAAVRPALVLHRVRGQALAAALLLAGLRLAEDLGHALLVHIVQTLMDTHTHRSTHTHEATINANSAHLLKAPRAAARHIHTKEGGTAQLTGISANSFNPIIIKAAGVVHLLPAIPLLERQSRSG